MSFGCPDKQSESMSNKVAPVLDSEQQNADDLRKSSSPHTAADALASSSAMILALDGSYFRISLLLYWFVKSIKLESKYRKREIVSLPFELCLKICVYTPLTCCPTCPHKLPILKTIYVNKIYKYWSVLHIIRDSSDKKVYQYICEQSSVISTSSRIIRLFANNNDKTIFYKHYERP